MSIKDSKLSNLINPDDFPQKLVMYNRNESPIPFDPSAIDEACDVLSTMNTDWFWEIYNLDTITLKVRFLDTQVESELGEFYNVGDLELISFFRFMKHGSDSDVYDFKMERIKAFASEANMFSVQNRFHPHASQGDGRMCFGDTGMSEMYEELTHTTLIPEKLSHFLFELGSWVGYESSSTGPYINFNDEVSKLISRHSGTPEYNNTPADLDKEIENFIADVIHNPKEYRKSKKTLSRLFFVRTNYDFVSSCFLKYMNKISSPKRAVFRGNNALVNGIQRSDGERIYVNREEVDVSRVMGNTLFFTRTNGKLEPPRMTMNISDQLTTLIHPDFHAAIKGKVEKMFRDAMNRKKKSPIEEYNEKVDVYAEDLSSMEEDILNQLTTMETA